MPSITCTKLGARFTTKESDDDDEPEFWPGPWPGPSHGLGLGAID